MLYSLSFLLSLGRGVEWVLFLFLLCVLKRADCGKGSESIVQQALRREVPGKSKGQVERGHR